MTTRNDSLLAADSLHPTGRLPRWVEQHPLLTYGLLAYAITWTLLIGGFAGVTTGTLDPEGPWVTLFTQVAPAGPLIAALTITALTRGRRGLARLGRSLVRWRVHPLWYAFIFIGVPALMLAGLALFHGGDPLPRLGHNPAVLYTRFPLDLVAIALVTGLAEEPGWRGLAQPTANRRYQPLLAALVVSLMWALWHLPNALFGPSLAETITHLLATTVNGFLLAWAYNSTHSTLIVMLLHGSLNATNALSRTLFQGAASAPTPTTYYVVSALTFGTLILGVALLTRGRLGLKLTPPHAQD